MQFFPAALQNLADQFARLPGIGGKTAQRLAFHVLSLNLEDAEEFAGALLEAKRTVKHCPCCQKLTARSTTSSMVRPRSSRFWYLLIAIHSSEKLLLLYLFSS